MLTYDLISRTTLSSAATSVTFSSFPSTYADLVLIFSGSTVSGNGVAFRFNSDANTNYSNTEFGGTTSNLDVGRIGSITSGGPHFVILNIQDYANSTTYKTALSQHYRAGNSVGPMVALWRSTSAITSIEIRTQSGTVNFNSGSTFSLFGIAG